MMRWVIFWFPAFAGMTVVLGVAGKAGATDITVCASGCDQTTIADALAAAADNDTIYVKAEATYTDAVTIGTHSENTKNLTIEGYTTTPGDDGQFTLEPTGSVTSAFYLDNNLTSGSLTINNCIITADTACTYGIRYRCNTTTTAYTLTLNNVDIGDTGLATALIFDTGYAMTLVADSCTFTGTNYGIAATSNTPKVTAITLTDCTLSGGTTAGISFAVNDTAGLGTCSITGGSITGTGSAPAVALTSGTLGTLTFDTVTMTAAGNNTINVSSGATNPTITTVNLTDCTLGNSGSGFNLFDMSNTATVTTVNVSGGTYNGGISSAGAQAFGFNFAAGTLTTAKFTEGATLNTPEGLAAKVAGSIYCGGTALTNLIVDGCTFACNDVYSTSFWDQNAVVNTVFVNNTVTHSNASSLTIAVRFGEDDQSNADPLTHVYCANNTIIETATTTGNHMLLLGSGCDDSLFVNNKLSQSLPGTPSGNEIGFVIKGEGNTLTGNRVYGPRPLYLKGAARTTAKNNTFYSTYLHGVHWVDDTDLPVNNVITDNVIVVNAAATAYLLYDGYGSDGRNLIDWNLYYTTESNFYVNGGAKTLAQLQAGTGWAAYSTVGYNNDQNSTQATVSFLSTTVTDANFLRTMSPAARGTAATLWSPFGAWGEKRRGIMVVD